MSEHEKVRLHRRIHHHIRRAAQKVPRSKKAGFIALSALFATAGIALLLVHVFTPTHHTAAAKTKPHITTAKKPAPTPVPKPVVAAPAPVPAAPAPTVGRYGMSIGEQLNALSPTALGAALDSIKALGVSRLRMDFSWNSIQNSSSTKYSWTDMDRMVAAANAHGFTVLGVIDQAPAWARLGACAGDTACAPASSAAFANFAGLAASRYTPKGVNEWEIWNEPNNIAFWEPAPNPAAYTQLLQQSYTAIKRINPNATIISGALAPVDTSDNNIPALTYTADIYADGAGPYFNAFGFHPYSFPAYASTFATWNAWSQMASTTTSIRSIMVAHGDSAKQIWATEYGAPTGGPGALATTANLNFEAQPDHVDEGLQAAMASNMVATAATEPWLGTIFWYGYQDQGTDSSTNENFFGLLRANGSKKPAYAALQAAIAGH